MSVELIFWYWIYPANYKEINVSWRVSAPGPNCPGPNCPGAQLSGAQLSGGPTVRGPTVHFFRADSWAPDKWAPGPNCPGPNCPGPNLPRTCLFVQTCSIYNRRPVANSGIPEQVRKKSMCSDVSQKMQVPHF